MKKCLNLFLLLFSINVFALTETPYTFANEADGIRFHTLIEETRCIVCQGQNLADSNAPLAKDLRTKIYRMVTENKTDAEIKDYLVKRYGEFILLRPRWNKLTLFIWLFPLLGLVIASFFIIRVSKQNNPT